MTKFGYIEYKMPKEMADMYLKLHKGKVPNVNDYLCKIVNEEFGLKGLCTKVLIY